MGVLTRSVNVEDEGEDDVLVVVAEKPLEVVDFFFPDLLTIATGGDQEGAGCVFNLVAPLYPLPPPHSHDVAKSV